ncbi:MAG: hypothetical protein QXW74_03975 [Archaeoglobaceae archaeon]
MCNSYRYGEHFSSRKSDPDGDAKKLDPNEVLRNIYVAQAYNSNHQMLLVDNAKELAEKLKKEGKQVRLLIVDSLTSHFRAEYVTDSRS